MHKKPRLDDHHDGKEANIDSAMEDPIASTSQPTKNNGLEKRPRRRIKREESIHC